MALPKIQFAGGGERFQYLTHKGNDTTIRFVLNYPGLIDGEILRRAVRTLVMSVDILHGTFFTDPNTAYWKINEEVEEYHYYQYIRTEGDPSVTARSLSVLPMPHDGKAQLRCTLVQSDNASAMVLCISHLCVDGGDGKYLLNKLVECYNLILETGSADALEVKNGSRAPEKVYADLDLKEIMSLFKMPLSTEATSSYPFPTEEPGTRRMVCSFISREVMDAARKKAKAVGASANDLLLAAAYQVYAAFPEVEPGAPVSISSMMDLRRHMPAGETEGLSNLSGGLPTVLMEGVPAEFAETLRRIAEQTNAAKEDPLAGLAGMPVLHGVSRGFPVWMQMLAAEKVYGAMPVGLTNLGNVSCQSLALGDLIPTDGVFGGPLKKKPGMQISIMSFDGQCALAVYGQYTAQDAAHQLKMLEDMVQVIRDYAKE